MSLACLTNHWCYKQKQSNLGNLFPRNQGDRFFDPGLDQRPVPLIIVFWDADSMSSAILEGYKKYLKKSCTKDKK